jgi:hypothetical protein
MESYRADQLAGGVNEEAANGDIIQKEYHLD